MQSLFFFFSLFVYVERWAHGDVCLCTCVYALNQLQDGKIKEAEYPLMSFSETKSVKHHTKKHSTFFAMLFTQHNGTELTSNMAAHLDKEMIEYPQLFIHILRVLLQNWIKWETYFEEMIALIPVKCM